jgi:DNA (cytosine-5)-methyltransferase 1
MRPRLLDLFCGAGGATRGYQLAGFHVTGVDIELQPNYIGDEFILADAIKFLGEACLWGWRDEKFDAIHASPPCQVFSVATQHARRRHTDWLTPTRTLLEQLGLPWVIENVPGAPMRADYKLCGCMFGLGRLQRQRWFETSWHGFDLRQPCVHLEPAITITTKGQPNRTGYADEAAAAMGIDWMNMRERGLAIPPAYTEYIGIQLRQHIEEAADAKRTRIPSDQMPGRGV